MSFATALMRQGLSEAALKASLLTGSTSSIAFIPFKQLRHRVREHSVLLTALLITRAREVQLHRAQAVKYRR